ncbi:MAG: acyltransferase family protein [Bdellovibrionota bacterium]
MSPLEPAKRRELARTPYRADVDGMRAVAVLAVMIFHAFPSAAPGGFLGVDVFFVISGFLISRLILENLRLGSFTFSEFYSRRVRRIFPALILVMGFCLALGWFALFAAEFESLGRHLLGASLFVSNLVSWTEAGYFDTSSRAKPLLHLWSLGIEEQFYLILPFALFLAWRLKRSAASLLLLAAFASFAAYWLLPQEGALAWNLGPWQFDFANVFYSPLTRLWELLSGSLLAEFLMAPEPGRWASAVRKVPAGALALLGGVCILGSFLFLKGPEISLGLGGVFPVLGTLLLLLAGPGTWLNQRVLSQPALVWIGLISYPLYLWHWPLLSFLSITENGTASVALRALALAASVPLAWLTFRLVEAPLRFGSFRKRKVVGGLAAAMLVLGFAGALVKWYGGIANRSAMIRLQSGSASLHQLGRAPLRAWHEACQTKPEIPACVLTVPGPEATVALIGDSHAWHLFAGVLAYYQARNENVVDIESCTILAGVGYVQDGVPAPDCEEKTKQIYRYLAEHPSLRTVILSFRGPLNVNGTGFWPSGLSGGEEPGTRRLIWRADPRLEGNAEIYERGLRATFSLLSGLHREVIFIFDNPELGFLPASCVARPLSFFPSRPLSPCAIERSVYDNRSALYRSISLKVLKEFPQIKTFAPSDLLCDEKFCYAERQGKFLYADDDHFSREGSVWIGSLAPARAANP